MLLPLAIAHAATWGPCVGIDTAERAECTTVTVQEDHGSIGEGVSLMTVTVARLPAASPPTRHLWVVAPGIGDSSLAELVLWDDRPLPDDVEVYAIEHRGVGSNRLTCPDQEAPSSPGGATIEAEEIGACGDHLAEQLAPLSFIDTTQSSADLMDASEQLKGPEVDVVFLGSGYGAFLLQRALVVSGRPEGVILDGPWPDDASMSQFDAELDRVARQILAACEQDPACADRMGDDADTWIDAFLEDGRACEGLASPATATHTLATLSDGPPELQGLIPAVVMRSIRCKKDDIDALNHLRGALDTWSTHAGSSAAAALHLTYGELWRDPAPDNAGFLASSGRSRALDAGLADWDLPFTPIEPRYPEHERPVLLLHPEAAPLARSDVGERYPWEEHHQVDVPGAFGAVTDTACGQELLNAFLDDLSRPPAPCEASLDFVGDDALDATWLGTEDRWGHTGCGCAHPPRWSWAGAIRGVISRR